MWSRENGPHLSSNCEVLLASMAIPKEEEEEKGKKEHTNRSTKEKLGKKVGNRRYLKIGNFLGNFDARLLLDLSQKFAPNASHAFWSKSAFSYNITTIILYR